MRKTTSIKWLKWIAISATLSLALTAFGAYLTYQHLRGPTLGGDFTLLSVNGPVSLHDFMGKAVILYFGYTSCPDVCPVSLSRLSRALKRLPQDEKSQIQPIFISVDTRKDTPKRAQDYASYFMKGAIGLTGTKKQIDQVVNQYGTSYVIEDEPKSALGYTIQHPTSYFLIDKSGDFVTAEPTQLSVNDLAQRIQKIF